MLHVTMKTTTHVATAAELVKWKALEKAEKQYLDKYPQPSPPKPAKPIETSQTEVIPAVESPHMLRNKMSKENSDINHSGSPSPPSNLRDNSQSHMATSSNNAAFDVDDSVGEEQVATCSGCLSTLTECKDNSELHGDTNFGLDEIDPDSINILLAAAEATAEQRTPKVRPQRQNDQQLSNTSPGQRL